MEAVLPGVRFRKYDSNKGITKINYDYLGNPTRIQFADRSVTEYVYSADGRRLKTIHRTAVPQSTMLAIGEIHNLTASEIQSVDSTEYVGSYIYDNGSLARCNFDGGYVISPFVSTNYRFYIKDHLGNNRMVTDATGNVLQSNEYYPYGGLTGRSTNPEYQKFKYNGKEYDSMHGLNEYDYGARQYDPAIARFTSMDPLCEKYYHISPYAYCGGNPVNRVDLDGMEWKDADGNVIQDTKDVKVFIFYSLDFAEQAKVQYDEAVKQYGKNAVAMAQTSTNEEFSNDWGNMAGMKITNVMIMTHGKNQSITLDNGDNQITSTGNGLTNLNNNKAMNVKDLPTPKGNITNAVLNMYSCHSADTTLQMHGNGVHVQGELKGSKLPIAYRFAQTFNFRYVIGASESVNYHSFFTDFTPSWSKDYLKPYPANGGTWITIKRTR